MRRVTFGVTADDLNASSILPTLQELQTRVEDSGVATYLSTYDEPNDDDDDHPARDALLQLVDTWRTRAGDRRTHAGEAIRACADELLHTIATLNL